MNQAALYISYDGMLEPLGQSQVLAYLEKLAVDRSIHLLSFEKKEDWARSEECAALRARIERAGIRWHPRRYHKRPSALATAWDILVGMLSALWLVLRYRIRIVHARSYVAAVMAWLVTCITSARFVFDMRGFWADERVDGGLWPRDGRMYRVAKWFERRFLLSADHVVSLTHAAVEKMQEFDYLQDRMPPVTVIPTCADLERFVSIPGLRDADSFTLGYVGSVGTWYLFDEVIACFTLLRQLRPDARLLVVNRNEHAYIRARLEAGGLPDGPVEIRAAAHSEIPQLMARMDAGIFFYRPSYSRAACSPTKLGEFLGCGIPCLSNSGVGDMAELLRKDGVGVAIDAMDAESLECGVEDLLALCGQPGISRRCVDSARRHFSLEGGVCRYASVYRQVVSS